MKQSVILITGAAGGLAGTAAITLAKQGHTLILLDKKIAGMEQLYDRIIACDAPTPALYPFDLAGASEKDYEDLAEIVLQTYGSLQGLLHSAVELSAYTPIELYTTKDWGHTLNVNLNAPFLLTRVLLPAMKNSESASVVFTGDSVTHPARAYSGAYGVSKIAMEAFAAILAEEFESSNKIRVNTLMPGPVDSPLRKKLFPGEDKSQLATMESLAEVYRYLFCSESIGVSGQTINAQNFNLNKARNE